MKNNIPFGKPLIDTKEKNRVNQVLNSGIFTHGKISEEFESLFKKFTKAKYAITVSSCTAGMHLIYFTLGIGKNDEVIVPSQTHVATAHAVELVGAKPIFIDSENETGNIDVSKIEEKITKNTRAIAVVHYLGFPVDMIKINKIAKKYKLFVIEDCALSLGAKAYSKHTGNYGIAGIFSFYPAKHMTTGEGGMIITNNKVLAKKLKYKKAFGINKTFEERKIPGIYDCISLGYNYRMSEIHAAIGVEQIKKIPTFLEKRKKNFYYLKKLLNNIDGIKVVPGSSKNLIGSHYCLSILLNDKLKKKRNKIILDLKHKNIGTSIYYPHPVPKMSYYRKKYSYDKKLFPIAEKFSYNSIALPVGPHVTKKNCEYIFDELLRSVNKYRS